MIITGAFLFNLLCAMVPCEPSYSAPETPPISLISIDKGGHRTFKRSGDPSSNSIYEMAEPIVSTKQAGLLQGYFMTTIDGKQIYAFEGIPYALPPIGFLRFRAPVPVKPWDGIRKALKPGNSCLQVHMAKLARVLGNEDCLFLNIYTPKIMSNSSNGSKSPNLAVIIFIHGGGFIFGSGSEYGPSYLLQKDIIFVTINYRLGPLGFLSTGDAENPGNWGLKDQALAIQWIADNIEAFGGDPNKITLMGQSAGAVSVHLHMMSNSTKHLLNNVISLSASAFVPWAIHTRHQALKYTEKFAKTMRCPINRGTKTLMDCLRSKNPNFLVGNQNNLFDFLGLPPIALRPVIEPQLPGAFITESPETLYKKDQVAKIPFLCTSTKEEAEFFVMIFKGLGIYKLLLNHWRTAAPTIYDYRKVAANVTEVTQEIIKFYLNGTDPRQAPSSVFSDIGTDRYFTLGIRKALRAHSQIAPVYSYIFGFKSPVGMANAFWGQPHFEFGTPHGEDLTYFLNSTLFWPSLKKQDPAFAISKLMITLFSNFATKSEPLYTDENQTDVHIWDSITDPKNLKFLQIDTEVKMIPEPFSERIKLWERLNINDSFAYEYA